jgi:hypothetical protein
VASAPYGDLQIMVARETHGCGDVGASDATGDQARPPVDGGVPYCTGGVVVCLVSTNQPASEPIDIRYG